MTNTRPRFSQAFDLARLCHSLWWHTTYQLRAYTWRFNRRVRKTVTVNTRQGVFTIYCRDDVIGRDLFCYREWELDLAMRVKAVLARLNKFNSSGTLLDIGANIGVTSIGWLHYRLAQRAIAIEPEPNNFRLLQQNVRQNHFEAQMILLRLACSDLQSEAEMQLEPRNLGGHYVHQEPFQVSVSAGTRVQTERLDRLIPTLPPEFTENLALIWIDAEGYEGKTFVGGEHLFQRDIPVVAEIFPSALHRAGTNRAEFCAILASFWSNFWVTQQRQFVRYPISEFGELWDTLAATDTLDNVILCK